MGKIKTTKKSIMENYNNIISVGYCDLAFLLYYKEPIFYTTGIYGWNADIYVLDNAVIVTGYRPFGDIHASYYGICHKYNEKARAIKEDYNMEYETKKKKLNKLLEKFITECLENKDK